MTRSFQYLTSQRQVVGDLVMAPLERAGVVPMVIDAGARNGLQQLPSSYARRTHLVGFEPNENEYRKLVEGNTDAARCGLDMPVFGKQTFHPIALWSRDEQREFFVTTGTGACTLMGEPDPNVANKLVLVGSSKSHGEEHSKVISTVPVPCRSLDSLYPCTTIIDYFKLDVEGAELSIMEGARALFQAKSVLMVKTEFATVPYYSVHPLLFSQHAFLHEMGYRLIDLDFAHPRYSRGPTRIEDDCDRRLIFAGDAYFILDPDRNELGPETRHRMAAIAMALGFNSLGVGLMREAHLLSENEIDQIEVALNHLPVLARLRRRWNSVPEQVAEALARVRRMRHKR